MAVTGETSLASRKRSFSAGQSAMVSRKNRSGSVLRDFMYWGEHTAPMLVEPSGSQARCSFCGKQARRVRRVVTSGLASAPGGKFGQGNRICDKCQVLCEEILAETASP